MARWLVAAILASASLGTMGQESASRQTQSAAPAGSFKPAPTQTAPPASQPATQPTSEPTLRRPQQVDVLQKLLERQVRPEPILPEQPERRPGRKLPDANAVTASDGSPLLPEGTVLIERPGRLVVHEDRAEFVFAPDENHRAAATMEILKSQLLEAMESQAEGGDNQFIISAEVTRYHGRNYIILRKVLRRVPNGNLTP